MDPIMVGFPSQLKAPTAASFGASSVSFHRRSELHYNNPPLHYSHASHSPPGKHISHPSPPPHSLHPIPVPEEEEEETPFIAQYLISSFGFPRPRALKVSKWGTLAAIKSSARPDSVVRFLKDTGLSDTQIKATVSFDPVLLSCNVEETLKPRAHELVAAGFTGEILVQFIRRNPPALRLKNPISPRLQFWREFLGNDDEALLKVIQRNPLLFTFNIDAHVVPRLNLFRENGLSNEQIVLLLTRCYVLMSRTLDYLRWVFEQRRELRLEPGSRIFLEGLRVISCYNETSLNQKIEFFKNSYGWSQDDVCCAFRKFPSTFAYSEERVKSHMDFLIRKAMLDPRSIASQPMMLGYSMERTLVPRHYILSILKESGLEKNCKLLTACVLSEKSFLKRFVIRYEKEVPGLSEAYAAARSGKEVTH